jgi:hypothetical protein
MKYPKTTLLILPLLMLFMQCCNTTKNEVRSVAQQYLDFWEKQMGKRGL